VRRAAREILECHRRRRLLKLLDPLVAELRSGELTHGEACVLLAGHLQNSREEHPKGRKGFDDA
jgi:hypothetical protein